MSTPVRQIPNSPSKAAPVTPLRGRLERHAIAAARSWSVPGRWPSEARALLQEFASLNGLKVSATGFDLATLVRGGLRTAWRGDHWGQDYNWPACDHVFHLRRDRRAAATITQPYDSETGLEDLTAYAQERGLVLHSPPNPYASFHFPGWTRFIVITRADFGSVRWLPDQLTFQVQGQVK